MAWIDLGEWILVKGPHIEENTWTKRVMWMSFGVTARAFLSREKNRTPRHSEKIYTICDIRIPIPHANIFPDVPVLEVRQADLWEAPLLREKVFSLMREEAGRREKFVAEALLNLIEKMRGERKLLVLAEGNLLKGGLRHDRHSDDEIKILGRVAGPDGERDEVVYAFNVAGGIPSTHSLTEPEITETRRHTYWCPKLSRLVVAYIRDLARYMAHRRLSENLEKLADKIKSSEPWGRTVAKISKNLLAFPVDLRELLIRDLRNLGEKYGIELV
ncbi:MAG: hypothetical protein QMD77_02140 [Patescibacteria group bacterium]|nr:hypothetical protein [Patescibacteria group bacterium]